MKRKRGFRMLGTGLLVSAILTLPPGVSAASKYKNLHRFHYFFGDGGYCAAGLILDAAGNLYGTTQYGGSDDRGVVFKLTPGVDGSWTERVLHSFGTDGAEPVAGLIFDAAGNLYGTTEVSGKVGGGVVFKLTPKADGTWTESVLHNFGVSHKDGTNPAAGLIFDADRNLYGTTLNGGAAEFGTVFRLTRDADGSWKEKVLYSFAGGIKDGGGPEAGLIFDTTGNLYGTTNAGGANNEGTVFKLMPQADGSWKEKVLYSFIGGIKDGGGPSAGLIFDTAGNLFGTTAGGGAYGRGVVFQLTPNSNGSWKEKLLHQFTAGKDGGYPNAGLIFDHAGNLYGTTTYGGPNDCAGSCGVVFRLAPRSKSGWRETVLHTFSGRPGANPVAGVIFDAAGNLYGTTHGDTYNTFGSVFEITP